MSRQLALLIYSIDSSVSGLSRLLEARDCFIHETRSLEEAEHAFNAFPIDQLKFVFADLTLCRSNTWPRFLDRIYQLGTQVTLVCYHPQNTHALYTLLGQASHPSTDLLTPHAIKLPLMIGETPQFYEVLNLANRYAMHDITVLITGETGQARKSWPNIYIQTVLGRRSRLWLVT